MSRALSALLLTIVMAGCCCYAVRQHTDASIRRLAAQPLDDEPAAPSTPATPGSALEQARPAPSRQSGQSTEPSTSSTDDRAPSPSSVVVVQAGYELPADAGPEAQEPAGARDQLAQAGGAGGGAAGGAGGVGGVGGATGGTGGAGGTLGGTARPRGDLGTRGGPKNVEGEGTSGVPSTTGRPPGDLGTRGGPKNLGAEGREVTPRATPGRGRELIQAQPPERLLVPSAIPGANTRTPAANIPLTPLPPLPPAAPGPGGKPLTLKDLERMAICNNPTLRQVASDLEAAVGAKIQAGVNPNPTVGYEADTIGSGNTPGFQGGFIDQVVRTAGKRQLMRSAAEMDRRNAVLALRRARYDVLTSVRTNYFAVLVARESVRVSAALAQFTAAANQIQLEQQQGGQAALPDVFQLRVQAVAARSTLIQARNRYISAWKQLAASLGLPGLPLTELSGRVDMPAPKYTWDNALVRVLSLHTDVATAANGITRAQFNLRLAQVTPIPDVDLHLAIQHDYTAKPFNTTYNVTISGPVPIWDTNKGNIIQAQAALIRACEEPHRVRTDLTTRLADAFERYQNNLGVIANYRQQLPDAVWAYRLVYENYRKASVNVAFSDVLVAQQSLITTVTGYLAALATHWQAVTDVAALLQTDDLFQTRTKQELVPIPDLARLAALPCRHPCLHPANPMFRKGDPSWPQGDTATTRRTAGSAAAGRDRPVKLLAPQTPAPATEQRRQQGPAQTEDDRPAAKDRIGP